MPRALETQQRLDVFLARSRLIAPRQQAKRACENGVVSVDGRVAKPATNVRAGDSITVHFTDQELTVKVSRMPPRSLSKSAAAQYYEVLSDKRFS